MEIPPQSFISRQVSQIREGGLTGQFIGNFAPIPENYLCEGDAGKHVGRVLDIFSLYKDGFDDLGIELIENTPEEIPAVCIEMDDRIKGVSQTTEENEVLRAKFWSNIQEVREGHKTEARIGAEFLRNKAGLV